MRSQVCVMPAKCVHCGGVFDLSYDYNSEHESRDERELTKRELANKLLCWECRVRAIQRRVRAR